MSYETLIIEPGEGFTLIRFNRPDALNAPAGEATGLATLQPGETLAIILRISAA